MFVPARSKVRAAQAFGTVMDMTERSACGAEWLERALNGERGKPGRDVRHHVQHDGRTTDGSAGPA
ncbi:hypothetical protein N5079_29540 [Planotetraspora sp. A-T 1434]|uniref:hypothetical protein n=1 Tax=Planotetraspora sp. A-T 1434 TaxID=2979219 RepID=UPI0021C1C294|nr:hypothetical protein [Planotetraspora sp. A-T 1434]MCT9934355.1 hypothetical protein [Planotetraspora sp. A-T 1434]